MKFRILEEIKDTDFILDNLKAAISHTIPVEELALDMYDGMVKNLGDAGIREVTDFINSLKFPLKIYRGLKLKDTSDLDTQNIGVNWTIDESLFYENSSFNFVNYILTGSIREGAVDWGDTIQHYILYSRNKESGKYPEKEIIIKKGAKIYGLELYRK